MALRSSLLLMVAFVLTVFLPGCGTGQNRTTPRGPAGPIQQPPSGPNTISWDVPSNLHYPNWTAQFPDNDRIWLTKDPMDTVVAHYKGLLPNATQTDISPRHLQLSDGDIEVDIETDGTSTKLVFTPVKLLQAKSTSSGGCFKKA